MTSWVRVKLAMLIVLATAGASCASPQAAGSAPAPNAAPAANAAAPATGSAGGSATDYRLGVADKVRVLVFNEPTLSGEFTVNASGAISTPLIGEVAALGRTTTELQTDIEQKLRAGYLRDPHVSIDVLTFRPYYILGEVNSPGEYPFATGLTVLNAVATAKGFTYRADKRRVHIKHLNGGPEETLPLSASVPVMPGDTVRIGERYF